MSQTEDEEVGRVGEEGLLVGGECALERCDIADADSWALASAITGGPTLHDLEVGEKSLLQHGSAEHGAVGDAASKHLSHNVELVDLLSANFKWSAAHNLHKTRRDFVLWRTANGSEEKVCSTSVVELDSTQTRSVEVPAGSLCRVAGRGHLNLGQELVGLVVQVGLEVGAEEEVDDSDLEVLVLAEVSRLADGEEGSEVSCLFS